MIRIATIGTSVITTHFADAVAKVEGIQLGTVFSRDAERAREFAVRIGAPASGDDLDAILADPAIDAVYVGSPNAVHAEQVRRAIAAGVHVFVEKPAVATAAEWAELVAAADRAGVVLLEGIRTAYDAGTAAVRELLPSLGTIRRASVHYQKRSSRYSDVLAGKRVNIFDPAMGGGALADLGVYGVHALILLFGAPETVQAASVPLDAGVDGAGIALLGYPGFVADVSYSKITSSSRPSEIQGEDATLTIDEIASPRHLVRTGVDGSVEEWNVEAPQHSLVGEVQRFVDLIVAGETPAEDNERTRLTLETLERIRTAAR
ncbi:Gfo/Idh/MocA family protein [Microbacterium sp. cx-59]|uniref:Gfo/Idh/MocA family protein n=1 Tax=Microbacterium sp. cx-59 TaxID=2891207 RepID=UPI001E5A9531|nr:Gfo/Idh/MocA family oxidoreductase [Microbacterium sp. cx-59]MCC4908305.1 Gfo/Idh/MocA family oxidoreductase [Microbacterium sp. cx-59]